MSSPPTWKAIGNREKRPEFGSGNLRRSALPPGSTSRLPLGHETTRAEVLYLTTSIQDERCGERSALDPQDEVPREERLENRVVLDRWVEDGNRHPELRSTPRHPQASRKKGIVVVTHERGVVDGRIHGQVRGSRRRGQRAQRVQCSEEAPLEVGQTGVG